MPDYIKRRMDKLESSSRGSQGYGSKPCEECGYKAGGPVEYLVTLLDEVFDTSADAPEFCSACGRQLSYVVTWPEIAEKE